MSLLQVQEAAFDVTDAVETLAWRFGAEDEVSLMLMDKQQPYDAQDRRTGMDTYCLVGPGPRFGTYYGGIERYSWSGPGQLQILLSPAASEALDVQADLTLEFINAQDEQLTRQHLDRLVVGR